MSVLLSDFIYLFSQLCLKFKRVAQKYERGKSVTEGRAAHILALAETVMSPAKRSRDNRPKHVLS